GKSVLINVGADWDGDELKLRALSILDLEKAAAQAGEGLKIYLENTEPLGAIAAQLRSPGKGLISVVVPGNDGQGAEIRLPQKQQVSVVMRNAIKSLPGVAAVESV